MTILADCDPGHLNSPPNDRVCATLPDCTRLAGALFKVNLVQSDLLHSFSLPPSVPRPIQHINTRREVSPHVPIVGCAGRPYGPRMLTPRSGHQCLGSQPRPGGCKEYFRFLPYRVALRATLPMPTIISFGHAILLRINQPHLRRGVSDGRHTREQDEDVVRLGGFKRRLFVDGFICKSASGVVP